jgi:hypothetical protein
LSADTLCRNGVTIPRLHARAETQRAYRVFGPWCYYLEGTMMQHDQPDLKFDAATARLLRREALRRAAHELNTTSGPGLESVLARISAEVTAEAAGRTPPVSPLLVETVRLRRDKP